VEFQRSLDYVENYSLVYLDKVSAELEAKYLGTTFRVSFDNGVTFGPLYKSPVTSPHGPVELRDGTILWVGRSDESKRAEVDGILAYTLDPHTGEMEYRGAVEPIFVDGEELLSCEPHAIELPDGTLLCHIRVQKSGFYFTTYQTESTDGGRTWSKPRALLGPKGGAPSHLILLDNGPGGTGIRFDWSLVENVPADFILAGGISGDNVKEAIERCRPWAVDVSSSLETDGYKDPDKIREFMKAAAEAAGRSLSDNRS
jgi:hypothetical protein